MLEKKCASGVHLTPKEMQVTNLLLNEEEDAAEEEAEARREEEELEEEEEAERLLRRKKTSGKSLQSKDRKSEEMEEEGRKGGCSSQNSEDQDADKITFNPGPDIPIIAGMPDAELLDEEQPPEDLDVPRCTALVPYSSPAHYLRPITTTAEGDVKSDLGSFCAPPGMALSVNKHVTPRTPASLASLDLEALSPRLLSQLPRSTEEAKELDVPLPKMSFPGNSAIVGFLEPKRCKSPNPKITSAPVASGEIGRLFSPVGDEGTSLLHPSGVKRSHFDPCASPVSPCSPGASPFSKCVAGGVFPRLQIGGSSSRPTSISSSRCQETESPAATPMDNSVPDSNLDLDAVGGVSPPQMGRKIGSYVWFEDEAVAAAGSIERVQTLGSPQDTEENEGVPQNAGGENNNDNDNDDDEWEWVCPDGGWGWLVLAGSMLVNALVPGMVKSFGVLFLEFLRVFHASPLAASWIPALCYFLYSSLGPVACVLSNRFSYRTVTFLGGFLAAMGMILSYFAHSITYLYLSYGILVGAGAGLAFPPGVFIVASYFDKRRGLANGLCVSGSALGSILLPPLLRLLLVTYGYRGAVLLMGGITFHVWVGAMLYHPVEKHMKRVRRKNLLAIEAGTPKLEKGCKINLDEETDVAQTALLPRSEAVPIPGQRKVFWYVGKSPGDEEELGIPVEGGDGRRKSSTVQQQASMHRRRRRSFSPVDERPLVEVDEEEETANNNSAVGVNQSKKLEPSQEVEGTGKIHEGESTGRKEWRSGSRQRKTSRGFAESVPEEVEDEDGTDDGNKNKARHTCAEVAGYSTQGSVAFAGSTQSHLHHLSPRPTALPRSLSAASYASTSTAPPPAPMGTLPPALSASSSSFRFVSSIHHGSALAALQTEGSVSVLAASTFTLRSVGQAVGWDGGFWERIRTNLLGGSNSHTDQRQMCKPCNCLGKRDTEKVSSPKMSGVRISGKNLPALERISNHHSLDRKQLGQVGERKISVASFISARDIKVPTGNIDIPRKYLDSQDNSQNCTPKGDIKMNGRNLSPDSLQAQDWTSNLEISTRDDGLSKFMCDSKDDKEENNLLGGHFLTAVDATDSVDKKPVPKKLDNKSLPKKKKSGRKTGKRYKKQPENVQKKKLFDLSLLTDSLYLILLLSNSTSAIGYTNFTILLPAWASSLGFSSSEASLLLSVVAATDLIGRIGGAALSDLRFMPRRWYYVGGLAVSGVVLAFLPLFAAGPALMQDVQAENGTPYIMYSSAAQVSSIPPFERSGIASLSYASSTSSQDEILYKTSTAIPSHVDDSQQNSSSNSRVVREIGGTPTSKLENDLISEESKSTPEDIFATSNTLEPLRTQSGNEQMNEEDEEETHMSSPAYLQLAAACSIFGLSSGAYVGVTAALFSDMLGPERLASSFGLSLLANGILQLAGPPLCGLALSKIPSDNDVEPTLPPMASDSNREDMISPPGPAAYAPIISTLGLFLVAGAGMWVFMPGIERKRREKEGGVMI